MRIQIISDLHLEFFSNDKIEIEKIFKILSDNNSDVLVICGDFSNVMHLKQHLQMLAEIYKRPIFFICGNHDYYFSYKTLLDTNLKINFDGHPLIHILNNSYYILDDIVFIGSTGWWDESNGKISKNIIDSISDFKYIYDIVDNKNGVIWGQESKIFLTFVLQNFNMKYKKVVCTHNGPIPLIDNTNNMYINSKLNTCFYNQWYNLFDYNFEFWCHGHTHNNREEIYNNKKIICNPYGYKNNDINKNFDFSKIIEI